MMIKEKKSISYVYLYHFIDIVQSLGTPCLNMLVLDT